MSVEAAVALPLFLFFSIALLSPIRWLDEQRRMQTEAEQYCEEMSLWAYVEDSSKYEEDLVIREWSYMEEIPLFSGSFRGVKMNVAAQRRKWIGLDGKLRSSSTDENRGFSTEEMVYVGKEMGRYHLRKDCHYLSNQYETITEGELKIRRTSDGRIVRPCGTCKPDFSQDSVVYVTTEGKHYHKTANCPSMVSYVRTVPLRQVLHLGPCSYCSSEP